MIDDTPETPAESEKFDYSSFPQDIVYHERRGPERRNKFATKTDTDTGTGAVADTGADAEANADASQPRVAKERRARKERRRRIDPTTFEKQYTEDELEFMNAMQQFKVQSCKSFPTHGEVLQVAFALGYRKVVKPMDGDECDPDLDDSSTDDPGESAPIDVGIAHADSVIS